MAKRLIKSDGLWTPPHVPRARSRKAFAPPRAVGGISPRFLNRRCCCGEAQPPIDFCSKCITFGEAAYISDLAVDLSSLGLTDGTCDGCDELSAIYTLTPQTEDFFGDCRWEIVVSDICGNLSDWCLFIKAFILQIVGPPKTFQFFVDVSIKTPGVFDACNADIGGFARQFRYKNEVHTNTVCLYPLDGEDKLTLDKYAVTGSAGCTGSGPATIRVWDASP